MLPVWVAFEMALKGSIYFLWSFLSETVKLFLPFALRDDNTLRPLAVAILSLKPCLLRLFLLDG